LSAIQEYFRALGHFGRYLTFRQDGIDYRVRCDDSAFIIYRPAGKNGLRHHIPGWPVFLVTPDVVFYECCAFSVPDKGISCISTLEKCLGLVGASVEMRRKGELIPDQNE
jgi:hypothetical protein